jgi:hypothetical protein
MFDGERDASLADAGYVFLNSIAHYQHLSYAM